MPPEVLPLCPNECYPSVRSIQQARNDSFAPTGHKVAPLDTQPYERAGPLHASKDRFCCPASSKLVGSSHASKPFRMSGHSPSTIAYQAVSRFRPLTTRCCRNVLHWTMGEYDMVAIYDMPSDEAFASLIIKIGEAGLLRTSSLKGITVNETGAILESIV